MHVYKRDSSDQVDHGGGLSRQAQIAIAIVIPVVFLLGALAFFVWRTERTRYDRRRNSIIEAQNLRRPTVANLLRTDSSSKMVHISEPPQDMGFTKVLHTREGNSPERMHELEDTGTVELHDLEEKGQAFVGHVQPRVKVVPRDVSLPLPTYLAAPQQIYPPRKDSAVQATLDRLESRDSGYTTSSISANSPTDALELDTKMTPKAQRYRNFSSNTYHTSLQPSSPVGEFRSGPEASKAKREARVASSQWSKEVCHTKDTAARFSVPTPDTLSRGTNSSDSHSEVRSIIAQEKDRPKPVSRETLRMLQFQLQQRPQPAHQHDHEHIPSSPSEANATIEEEDDNDEASHLHDINHPILASPLKISEIAKPGHSSLPRPDLPHHHSSASSALASPTDPGPSRRESSALPQRPSSLTTYDIGQRLSTDVDGSEGRAATPSWMRRLSAQDFVERKWRDGGQIVAPQNPRMSAATTMTTTMMQYGDDVRSSLSF